MFNALKYTEDLEKVGFTAEQAQTTMKVLMDVMNENFATNSALRETEIALRSEIRESETRLRSEMKELGTTLRSEIKELGTEIRSEMKDLSSGMKELEYRLTIKLATIMGTMMTIAIGATATLIKVMHT